MVTWGRIETGVSRQPNKKALTSLTSGPHVEVIVETSVFLAFFLGLQKVYITECRGKTHENSYDCDENVSAVANKLLKHCLWLFTEQRYHETLIPERKIEVKFRQLPCVSTEKNSNVAILKSLKILSTENQDHREASHRIQGGHGE